MTVSVTLLQHVNYPPSGQNKRGRREVGAYENPSSVAFLLGPVSKSRHNPLQVRRSPSYTSSIRPTVTTNIDVSSEYLRQAQEPAPLGFACRAAPYLRLSRVFGLELLCLFKVKGFHVDPTEHCLPAVIVTTKTLYFGLPENNGKIDIGFSRQHHSVGYLSILTKAINLMNREYTKMNGTDGQ